MPVSEACALWIEQRIEDELEEQETTGKSLRAIGRELSKEILKYFEAKVAPETLKEKARRMKIKGGTNVPEDTTTENNSGKEVNQDNQVVKTHGGKRPGAGRKLNAISQNEGVIRQRFHKAYEVFFEEVQESKLNDWKVVSKNEIAEKLNLIITLINV